MLPPAEIVSELDLIQKTPKNLPTQGKKSENQVLHI
jgi:hypothetical protein